MNRPGAATLKYRTGVWAGAGFFVAVGWALYALAATPPALSSADPMMMLVRLTCPIAIFSYYPISVYWVLLANASTYAFVGLMVETLRRGLNHAH
jgi:hypothetical protein